MKTTTTKQILFFAVLCCIAASVKAQTVDVMLQCGQSYTINSTAPATNATGLTYRWLENGSIVAGIAADYTVPATKHAGTYTYIRQAKTKDCPDWQNSNAITVAVVNPDDGTCIAGLTWAKYNVDVPGSFTTSPDSAGRLYVWDNKFSLSQYDEPISEFPDIISENTSWAADNNPCPTGWHVPSVPEWQSLFRSTPNYFPTCNGQVTKPIPFNYDPPCYDGCGTWTMGPGSDYPNNQVNEKTVTFVGPKENPFLQPLYGHYWSRVMYWSSTADPDNNEQASGTWGGNYHGTWHLCWWPKNGISYVRCVK
jgi:uncharacterized protein (TIGR02145 family)